MHLRITIWIISNWLTLILTLGIKRAAARSIIDTYLREGRRDKIPRGGARHDKMDEDMKTVYIYFTHTLKKLNTKREREARQIKEKK